MINFDNIKFIEANVNWHTKGSMWNFFDTYKEYSDWKEKINHAAKANIDMVSDLNTVFVFRDFKNWFDNGWKLTGREQHVGYERDYYYEMIKD